MDRKKVRMTKTEGGQRDVKMEELGRQWLEQSRLRVKESTYVKYWNQLHVHILPDLGELRLSELTADRVNQFLLKQLTEGRVDGQGGLAEKTVQDLYTVLKSVCIYGETIGYHIPCRFELLRLRRTVRNEEVHVLDRRQCEILERELFRSDSRINTGMMISLYMGLRLGEVCALKRENIKFGDHILQVRMTMQRIQDVNGGGTAKTRVILTVPKSRSSVRDIPIPDFIMERLWEFRSASPDTWLMTGSTERFMEPRTLENGFKRLANQCRLNDVTYHMLRHTFATRCIECGFEVKTLSEILGHSNVNITLNRYVHSSMESKRKNMCKVRQWR